MLLAGGTAQPVVASSTTQNPQNPRRLLNLPMAHPCSSKLRVDFLEIALVHQHLARLAADGWRDESFHFHHVDEPCGAAESDPQPALQVRDRRLSARDDDA